MNLNNSKGKAVNPHICEAGTMNFFSFKNDWKKILSVDLLINRLIVSAVNW